MQLRRLLFVNKFTAGGQTAKKKKFKWWKALVAGLLITAAGLLLASCILASASMEDKSSEDGNLTKESSITDYEGLSSKDTLKITQLVLPMAQVYCSIRRCMVICSRIPAASNPGIVAAVFVDSDYETHCPDNVLVEELIFDNCRFTGNALSSRWFPAKLQVKKLTFKGCSLTVINEDAFSTEPFETLTSLSIVNNGINVFQKSLFDALTNLEELVVTNNVIRQAEADLLAGTSNALQIIQIDNAIYSENVLINITGKSQLPKVLILSLTGNMIANISANTFKGVPNVQSIYLTNSAVSSVQADAFNPISGSIRQLFLADNKLSSLPSAVFLSILGVNPNLKLTLSNNEWNCDCESEWLKNLTMTRNISIDEPLCATPERNAALTFSEANFCGVETSNIYTDVTVKPSLNTDFSLAVETTEPIDTGNGVTTVVGDLITLMCAVVKGSSRTSSRKLLAMREFKFRSRFPSFSVQEEEDGSVYVNLETTQVAYTLIWFGSEVNDVFNLQGINCITDVKNSLYLRKLKAGAVYTICLVNMRGDVTSPFNCISLKKRDEYEDSLWLANEDKTMIFAGLSIVLIFVCVSSVIGSYCVVWKNPQLLRGSKRIIMVRHRAADAIVLPEGIQLDSPSKDFDPQKAESSMSRSSSDKDYMTPLEKRRLSARKSSVISGMSSRSSANSYVSGIEPTSIQLMSWRIKRIRNNLSCRKSVEYDDSPPPLPPPRNRSIPSLSLNVEERDSDPNDRTVIPTFANRGEDQQAILNKVNDEQRL